MTLSADTKYELSFWARTAATENWPVGSSAASRALYIKWASVWGTRIGTVSLYDEWKNYTVRFTPSSDGELFIYFCDGASFNDVLPFDIDGMTLYAVDAETNEVTGKNLIVNDDIIGAIGWSGNGTSVDLLSDKEFYRVTPPADGTNANVVLAGDDVLVPGVYHITGKFRLAEPIDYNKISMNDAGTKVTGDTNNAKLSAWLRANGILLKTLSGSTEATINPYEWTEVTFVLDTTVDINMSDIKFEVDGSVQLDFIEIDVELTERKASITDVASGLIVTVLLLKHMNKYNRYSESDIAIDRDWVINGEKATLIKSGASVGETNSYISVSSRECSDVGAVYNNNAAMFMAGKQYKISFKARTLPITKEGNTAEWGLRGFSGDTTLMIFRLSMLRQEKNLP